MAAFLQADGLARRFVRFHELRVLVSSGFDFFPCVDFVLARTNALDTEPPILIGASGLVGRIRGAAVFIRWN